MSLFFVLVSQLLSALGDNALLFAAVALMKSQHYAEWTFPVLQEFFVLAFIVLAAFSGPLADALPKGRVMMAANGLKLAGAIAMVCGVNPFVAYGLVGVGAALYSPAKYGILGELLPTEKLVSANGMMEGTTIVAILVGAISGAKLADWNTSFALISVAGMYLLAGLTNLGIPKLPAARPLDKFRPIPILKEFVREIRPLWADAPARLSLLGTSAFWASGAALRFLLIAWVPFALHEMSNAMAANLNAVTAVGIVFGAGYAAWKVPLAQSQKVLPLGILLGIAVLVMAHLHSLYLTVALLVVIGALGGALVVPLNALLQSRGSALGGTGHAVAVQNLFENSAMLAALVGETLLGRAGLNPVHQVIVFGALMAILMALLQFYAKGRNDPNRQPAG
jgi:LPLT family lysophospholipid transporter-like MFS transporter